MSSEKIVNVRVQQTWSAYAEDLREIYYMLFESLIESFYVAFCVRVRCICMRFVIHARIRDMHLCADVDAHDVFRSKLLFSKSRVAPVRGETITLLKLELYEAVVRLL